MRIPDRFLIQAARTKSRRVLVAEDSMREENGGDGTGLIRPSCAFAKADTALYRAKNEGRARVCKAD